MLPSSQPPQPLLLLIQQLKQPSLKVRSIKSLSTIALALGPIPTRQYLIPFLSNLFHQQNQQLQLAILQTLPSLIPYLGHSFYSYLLLEMIVDVLCVYDEKEIRELGFGCLYKVLSRVDIRKAQNMLWNTMKELQEEKETRIKEVVIRMIPPIFIGLEPQFQQKFIQLFILYSNDQKEQVRVIVSFQLQQLIRIMPPAPETQIKILLEKFLGDQSDKVRINLIECIILLSQLLGEKVIEGYFVRLIENGNTSVMCEVYERIETIAKEFSGELLEVLFKQIESYSQFHQTLKNKILSKLPILFQVYPKKYCQTYLSELLLPPSTLQLQSTLAQSLCALRDQQHLTLLLQQSDNSFKLKHLPKIPNLNNRIQMVSQMLKHKSFRVRSTILSQIQTRINNKQESVEGLLDTVLEMTSDRVAIVRASAANVASKIIQYMKLDMEKLKEKLKGLLESEVWYVRFAGLEIIKSIVGNKGYVKIWESVRIMKVDEVISVRMKVVEIAVKIGQHGVKSCLQEVDDIREQVQSMY